MSSNRHSLQSWAIYQLTIRHLHTDLNSKVATLKSLKLLTLNGPVSTHPQKVQRTLIIPILTRRNTTQLELTKLFPKKISKDFVRVGSHPRLSHFSQIGPRLNLTRAVLPSIQIRILATGHLSNGRPLRISRTKENEIWGSFTKASRK